MEQDEATDGAAGRYDSVRELGRRGFMKSVGAGLGFTTASYAASDEEKHTARRGAANAIEALPTDSLYGAYQVDMAEYIGTLDSDLSTAIDYLKQHGYTYQVLSAEKYHPDTGAADDGSYRLLDPDDTDKQWHVHLWETDDGVQLFSHYEYKPEFWAPIDESRVAEHYRPDSDAYIQGQHSPEVKELLEEHGVYARADAPELVGNKELPEPTGNVGDILA